MLPYCISGQEIVPVFHLGAVIGHVPFWDQRDEFGDTNMLVIKPEEGASLARALGQNWMVLMRRHGATVAGTRLRELTFRTVFTCHNAELQSRAMAHGHVDPLSAGEIERCGGAQHAPALDRTGLGLLGAPCRARRADAAAGSGAASAAKGRPPPAKAKANRRRRRKRRLIPAKSDQQPLRRSRSAGTSGSVSHPPTHPRGRPMPAKAIAPPAPLSPKPR